MYIDDTSLDKIKKIINISNDPFEIFEKHILEFFDEISKIIMTNKKFKKFPDLITFGFWCRKKNLENIKKNYPEKQLGRGLVFHICPSNVPLNFAFSLAFGLLSGNYNLVRLPSREFEQVKTLVKIMNLILSKRKFRYLKKKIILISYNRSDKISEIFSSKCDARMIWGGDETIKKFKKFDTKPRCVDLTFSNRFSISVINSNSYLKLNYSDKKKLLNNFIKDSFTMDQQGCSSPKALFWLGKIPPKKKEEFWKEINTILSKNNKFDLSKTNQKIYQINKNIILNPDSYRINNTNFQTLRLKLLKNRVKKNIEIFQVGYGTFIEIDINNIKEIKKYISERCQTITQYGFENIYLKNIFIANNFKGIDRIVKIGMAFEMSNIWDGYDIINSLSRKITVK